MGSRRVWAWAMVSSHESSCAVLPLQALFDLEATNAELKSDLRDLYITSAQEVDVSSGRKAIIIHVSWLRFLLIVYDSQQPQLERHILSDDSPPATSTQPRKAPADRCPIRLTHYQPAAGNVECSAPWPVSGNKVAGAAALACRGRAVRLQS